jgi:hypothetical protein
MIAYMVSVVRIDRLARYGFTGFPLGPLTSRQRNVQWQLAFTR